MKFQPRHEIKLEDTIRTDDDDSSLKLRRIFGKLLSRKKVPIETLYYTILSYFVRIKFKGLLKDFYMGYLFSVALF